MIKIKNIYKSFQTIDGIKPVLSDVNLEIAEGEIISLVGANGSGKTTLLRIIAKLINPDKGDLIIGSDQYQNPGVSIVPQRYRESLFPWRTVSGNLHLPFETIRSVHEETKLIQTQVDTVINELGISDIQHRRPATLSGGQAQLATIARALVASWTKILLLDEPFSALDGANLSLAAKLVVGATRERKISTIVITHDLDFGILIADRIAVIRGSPAKVVAIIDSPEGGIIDTEKLTTNSFLLTKKLILEALLDS